LGGPNSMSKANDQVNVGRYIWCLPISQDVMFAVLLRCLHHYEQTCDLNSNFVPRVS